MAKEMFQVGKEDIVYIDGEFVPKSQARVAVFDHCFLYGDGVYEGIRIYKGKIFRLDNHIDRIYNSAKAVDLNIPVTKPVLKNALIEVIRRNGIIGGGYIRLVISRGEGPLGMDPRKCEKPTIVIIAQPNIAFYQRQYEKGATAIISSTRRIPAQCVDPKIKSNNHLNLILARLEAYRNGADEAIMLDINGFIAEGAGDNLFIVREMEMFTPLLINALGGITRRVVFEMAREKGYNVFETFLTSYDIYTADELFLTGTGAGILPIVEVDERKIGEGRVGPVTKVIMESYKEITESEGKY